MQAPHVVTTLCKKTKEVIEQHNSVSLIGTSGSGKSFILYYLSANPLADYYPILCKSPSQIRNYIELVEGKDIQLLFLVDEPIGSSYLQQKLVDEWVEVGKTLEIYLGKHKFVFASRDCIWADCDMDIKESPFFTNTVEVSSDSLTVDDKRELLQVHLGEREILTQNQIETIVSHKNPIAYSQSCKLMSDSIRQQPGKSGNEIIQIFQKPYSYLCSEIRKLADKERGKYAVLCLTMLSGGSIPCEDLSWSRSDVKADVRERVEVVDATDCPYLTCEGMQKWANELSGTYLEKVEVPGKDSSTCQVYKFSHDSVHEAVTMEFAKLHLDHCLKYLNPDVIANIARPCNYNKREQEFAINFPTDYYEKLAKFFTTRVIDENGNLGPGEVFNNPCVIDEPFQIVWIDYLKKTSPDELTAFTQSKGRWFDKCVLYCVAKSGADKLLSFLINVHHLVCTCGTYRREYGDLSCVLRGAVGGDQVQIVSSYLSTSTQDCEVMTRRGLEIACEYGCVRTAEYLLKISTPCKGQNCPCVAGLSSASVCGRTDIVRLCVSSHGQDVNTIVDDDGRDTSLHFAAHEGQSDVVKFLLSVGADVNLRDKYGYTSLDWALGLGHTDVVNILLPRGADVNRRDTDGRTILYGAVYSGRTDVVKILLANGADVNLRDNDGRTSLDWAVVRRHTDVVNNLLTRGADVNLMGNDGRTSLDWAVIWGHTDVVTILLGSGADVNMRDKYGYTSLHWAVGLGHTDVLNILLTRGADVNARDIGGRTILHGAVYSGRTDVVKILLTKGADVNLRDNHGRTSLDWAVIWGYTDVENILLASGARHVQQ